LAAAFTDHHAVIIRLAVSAPLATRRRGLWKLNLTIMKAKTFSDQFRDAWETWGAKQKFYTTRVM
jgi:hypothetical protein